MSRTFPNAQRGCRESSVFDAWLLITWHAANAPQTDQLALTKDLRVSRVLNKATCSLANRIWPDITVLLRKCMLQYSIPV